MAKKKAGEAAAIFGLVLIGGAIALLQWVAANIKIVAAVAAAVVALFVLAKVLGARSRKKEHEVRVQTLLAKYKKQDVVDRILNQEYWTGQTSQQLTDSLGEPASMDRQVLKTKTKEVWKYDEVRKGQYSLKVEVENGKVVGWTSRD